MKSIFLFLKEILNYKNYKTLIKAIGREPLDVVIRNAFYKILRKPPITREDSLAIIFSNYILRKKNDFKFKKLGKSLLKQKYITKFYITSSNQSQDYQEQLKRMFTNQSYECFEIIDVNKLSNLDLAKNDFILILNDCWSVDKHFLLENALYIQKYNPIWYYTDHIIANHGENLSPENLSYHINPQFNIDYWLAYNHILSPIILSNKIKHINLNIDDLILANHELMNKLDHYSYLGSIHNVVSYKPNKSRIQKIASYCKKHLPSATPKINTAQTIYIDREIHEFKEVSIIIPFKDQIALTITCVNSIIEKTTYLNYNILLVSNNSKAENFLKIKEYYKQNKRIRLLAYNEIFNYSAINNWAVSKCDSDYILFLNNDTEVINKGWLTNMVKEIQRPEVGAVGALLLYPDNTVQHAGVIVGVGHVAGHAHRNYKSDSMGYLNRLVCVQEYTGVTAACLLTKKQLFNKLSGFDAENLAISNNDVDYCLRIKAQNFKIIYTPHAQLYHFESKSRKSDLDAIETSRYNKELNYMKKTWNLHNFTDPYYSKFFSINNDNFTLPDNFTSPNMHF